MATANAALDAIGTIECQPGSISATPSGRWMTLAFQISGAMNRLYLIKETSTNAAVRDAATEAVKRLQEWAVGLDYREDVYRAVKAYADTQPKLTGEDAQVAGGNHARLSSRRAGAAQSATRRGGAVAQGAVAMSARILTATSTKAKKPLKFTKAELEGAAGQFAQRARASRPATTNTRCILNVTWQYLAVMEHAKSEAVRKRRLDRT